MRWYLIGIWQQKSILITWWYELDNCITKDGMNALPFADCTSNNLTRTAKWNTSVVFSRFSQRLWYHCRRAHLCWNMRIPRFQLFYCSRAASVNVACWCLGDTKLFAVQALVSNLWNIIYINSFISEHICIQSLVSQQRYSRL